jgi:hypothetical protein
LIELIAVGDPDAAAGFYDARSPSVREYCSEICSPELIDEATLGAFVDFLARVGVASSEADADDLLRKATRGAAASRMHLPEPHEPACRSIPELIAARANGELPHGDGPITEHLKRCSACRRAARRLADAEDALARNPTEQPPQHVRAAWLQLAARTAPTAEPASGDELSRGAKTERTAAEPVGAERVSPWLPAKEAVEPSLAEEISAESSPEEAGSPAEEAGSPAEEAGSAERPLQEPVVPPTPEPIVVRRRRGGLVGAARRVLARRVTDEGHTSRG